MALIATHLGVADEEQINNMSYNFFEDVLTELGHKLTYDAVVNYAGNSFAKDSWEMIMDSNPMAGGENKNRKQQQTMADFFGGARIATKEEIASMNAYKGAKGKNEKT